MPRFHLFILFLILMSGCQTNKQLWAEGTIDQKRFFQEIPFTTIQGLLFVDVIIKEKPYRFILDTGAPTVITKELATQLKLQQTPFGPVGDTQGKKQNLSSVSLPPVQIGQLTFSAAHAMVADIRAIPIFDCWQVDGLLGANLMAKTCIQIDYAARTVRMAHHCSSFPLKRPIRVPFSIRNTYTPVIQSLDIGGRIITDITLDYGSSNGITLPKKLFTVEELTEAPVYTQGISGTGLYGNSKGRVYYTPGKVPQLGKDNLPLRLREQKNRLLGTDVLRQFRATIDWKKNILWLERQQEGWPEWKVFGFGLEQIGSHLVIGTITVPSSAYKAGLQVGQKILEINGQSVTSNDYCQMSNALAGMKTIDLVVDSPEGRKSITVQRTKFEAFN